MTPAPAGGSPVASTAVPADSPALTRAARERGFAIAYETLVEALANKPFPRVATDARNLAHTLGLSWLDDATPRDMNALRQRYYDRFLVPSSAVFVPLLECRCADAASSAQRISWGPPFAICTAHAAESYERAGFDCRCIAHTPLLGGQLQPDALVCELAYLSHLKHASARHVLAAPAQAGAENVYDRFARAFLADHAHWIDQAAHLMRTQDDDFYARCVRIAARLVKADACQLAHRCEA